MAPRAARILLGPALAALTALEAAAQAPRSAIDWLSRLPEQQQAQPPQEGAPAGENGEGIEISDFTPPGVEGAGLIGPGGGGAPSEFWNGTSAARAAELLDALAPASAACGRLARRILVSSVEPPAGGGAGAPFLLGRARALVRLGALDDASALLDAAAYDGPGGPDRLLLRLRAGWLMADEAAPCARLAAMELAGVTGLDMAETIQCARVLGDDAAADDGIALAEGIGAIPARRLTLLKAQTDPALAATAEGPARVAEMSPLDLAMVDGIGAPRPADFASGPLAYAWADMTEAAPPRDRLMAAERLAAAGALSPSRLADLYASFATAQSGGAWGRAEALQALDAATGPEERAAALIEADARARAAGLRGALAPAMAAAAAQVLAAGPAERREAAIAAEILLLAGDPAARGIEGPERLRALSALAFGEDPGALPQTRARAARGDSGAQTLIAALEALPPGGAENAPDAEAPPAADAALSALARLAEAGRAPAADLGAALSALAAAGFPWEARRIAVELLLAPGAGGAG